ncbi:MAG: GT2 family glycosyltransferase [Gammaproteobacteria bacterium]
MNTKTPTDKEITTESLPSYLVEPDTQGSVDVALSIIIPTYNGREVTRACLDSIFANPPTKTFEVFVIDDASNDNTDELVRDSYPQVNLLRNDINVNYGRSNNRAMDVARGKYFYLLNNDTLMLPNALDNMIDFLDEHPDAGGVGSKLFNEDGSIQWSVKSLPCATSALFGARSPITRMFPNNRYSRSHLLHLDHDSDEPFLAPYVSSASYMLRREVFERVGGLDERLTYHVDADYCKRVSDAGWNNYYLPTALVIHLDHQGGTLVNTRRRFKAVVEFHRGSYIFYRKHQMRHFWEPMHAAVIIGLTSRFIVSLLRRVSQEVRIQLPAK